MKPANDDIDIDRRPDIAIELHGRVRMEGLKPVLEPAKHAEPAWLVKLARFEGDVTVTVSRAKKVRSQEANAYLWGVVYRDILAGLRQIALEAGEPCPFKDEQELHEAMVYVHLGTEVVRVKDVAIERPTRTRVLNSAQFSGYITALKAMAAERWRIYVRDAGERISA